MNLLQNVISSMVTTGRRHVATVDFRLQRFFFSDLRVMDLGNDGANTQADKVNHRMKHLELWKIWSDLELERGLCWKEAQDAASSIGLMRETLKNCQQWTICLLAKGELKRGHFPVSLLSESLHWGHLWEAVLSVHVFSRAHRCDLLSSEWRVLEPHNPAFTVWEIGILRDSKLIYAICNLSHVWNLTELQLESLH